MMLSQYHDSKKAGRKPEFSTLRDVHRTCITPPTNMRANPISAPPPAFDLTTVLGGESTQAADAQPSNVIPMAIITILIPIGSILCLHGIAIL